MHTIVFQVESLQNGYHLFEASAPEQIGKGDRGSVAGLQYAIKGGHMATSFESMVKNLGLSPEEYKSSVPLKDWVRRNMDEKYVPSDLLKAWGFEKDETAEEEAA